MHTDTRCRTNDLPIISIKNDIIMNITKYESADLMPIEFGVFRNIYLRNRRERGGMLQHVAFVLFRRLFR